MTSTGRTVELPYGSWPSAITPALITQEAVGLSDVRFDGDDIWWAELRPSEGGRVAIVRHSADGTIGDLLPTGYSARTRVHEYGGGAWWPADGALFFANWDDQRLYRLDRGARQPRAITREPRVAHGLRYGDGVVSADGEHIICVRESHELAGGEVANELVTIPASGQGDATVLVSGSDFVVAPRLSPDNRWLSWIQWDHPLMPWNGTELWVAEVRIDGGDLFVEGAHVVAGGVDEAITQARWDPQGRLTFLSDRSEWWNVYRFAEPGSPRSDQGVEAVLPLDSDIGGPPWTLANASFGFGDDGSVLIAHQGEHGGVSLSEVQPSGDTAERQLAVGSFGSLDLRGRSVVGVVSSPTEFPSIVRVDLDDPGDDGVQTVRAPRNIGLDGSLFAIPEALSFPSADGRTAYGQLYRPTNPAATAPAGERPPLLVLSHGGPTAAASTSLALGVQFWTSRGFAVIDVDYGGSTGYGRTYRELLNGAWGVVDVEDCVAAANHLVELGEADPNRLAIAGGSAGGFTTLAALTFHDVFAAGASHFGVADLALLAAETHKFESRYLDQLVGRWPEDEALYRERSPIHHTNAMSCPIILLQGLEDEIVPPSQAEAMVAALEANGIPFAYVPFPGEQHGFRKAENIQRALTAELSFYGQVFDFVPNGDIEPVEIQNAEALRG